MVKRHQRIEAVEAALKSEDKALVLVAQKNPADEDPQPDALYTIGTQAVIKKMDRSEGQVQLGTGFAQFRSPDVIRILAAAGFHWTYLDTEHGAIYSIFTVSVVQA